MEKLNIILLSFNKSDCCINLSFNSLLNLTSDIISSLLLTKKFPHSFFNSKNDNIIFSENFELMKKIFLLFKEIKIESEIKKYFNDYIKNVQIKYMNYIV